MKYIISEKAKLDLVNIWKYTAENWSIIQADNYYKLIIEKIKDLTDYPQIGKDFGFVRTGYRGLVIKSHIIFYRISEERIEVIRILYHSMNIKNKI